MTEIKRPLPPDTFGKPKLTRPVRHAASHATGGTDPITGPFTFVGPLIITPAIDVTLASGAFTLMLGSESGVNLRFDNNEIQGVNNGAASDITLQESGGSVIIGNPVGHVGAKLVIGGAGASTANVEASAGGRIDWTLWDTSAAADDRRVDLVSLNGVGGPGSLSIGVTRTDAAVAQSQLIVGLHSGGGVWTSLRLNPFGTGNVQIGNGNGVIVQPDPGGSEIFRVGGPTRINGATVIQTGDLTLTTGRLVFSAVNGRILMGATSLTVRDSTDTANILGLTAGGALTLTGTLTEIAINARSGGGVPWEFYVPTTASYRLYHAGDQYVFTDLEFTPATAGGKTLGTTALPWGDINIQTGMSLLFGSGVSGAYIQAAGSPAALRFNVATALVAELNVSEFRPLIPTYNLGSLASPWNNLWLSGDANIKGLVYSWPIAHGAGNRVLQNNGSGTLSWVTPGAGSAGVAWSLFTRDLGVAKRSGTFDITGLSGLDVTKPVMVMQTNDQIGNKGSARDEFELDAIQLTGYVVDAATIRVSWWAPSIVVGEYAFAYAVGI